MYTLTLTSDERKAVDWIGNRYGHGNDLYKALVKGDWQENDEWGWYGEGDITFTLPEYLAWQIRDIGEECEYRWDCFAEPLAAKLTEFCEKIV